MSKNTLMIVRPSLGKIQKAISFYFEKMSQNLNGVFVGLENAVV